MVNEKVDVLVIGAGPSGTVAASIINKAGLTTWKAEGENLIELSRILKQSSGIDQVAFFGNELHVSSKNESHLLESIAPFKNYYWKKITPGLEDAFISLIKETKGQE